MIIFTMIIFRIVIIIMIMNHDDHDDVHQGPFDPRVQRCKALRLSHNPRRPQLQYHCCQVNFIMIMKVMMMTMVMVVMLLMVMI